MDGDEFQEEDDSSVLHWTRKKDRRKRGKGYKGSWISSCLEDLSLAAPIRSSFRIHQDSIILPAIYHISYIIFISIILHHHVPLHHNRRRRGPPGLFGSGPILFGDAVHVGQSDRARDQPRQRGQLRLLGWRLWCAKLPEDSDSIDRASGGRLRFVLPLFPLRSFFPVVVSTSSITTY